MSTFFIIIIAVLALIVIFFIATYNRLIRYKNRTDEAWSDISVQLKRRHDLIPNLIEAVKGYARHERELFQKVTEARSRAVEAGTPKEQAEAENALTGTLKSLFAVAENYPELKANQNFLQLQEELTDTENKIQASRRFYNTNVRDLNTALQSFPTNIVAAIFNFRQRDFFELKEEAEAKAPSVSF